MYLFVFFIICVLIGRCFRVQLFLDWTKYKHQSQRALEHSFVMSSSRPPTPYPIFRKSKIAPSEKDEKQEKKNDVVEYCKEMLQKSMLTGVPQIVSAPTTRSKVFKTFVVLGSFTGFLYQTSAFLVMYFSYPTLVDVQVTTPPFVDVPALTICNRNGLLRRAVPARISSQSSRHCWRSPLPYTSALIQRDFGCVLEVQQTKQLPHVAKVDLVLDESRSFFRVHTGYFSNIPKCIKAEFIASWGCSQSSVVSSSQR
ncbi:uncharacterized protein TNCV_2848231 [Trichonephila clavipes]|nr:uncharacterized protein TNCV_2848231 [Trichonephila clavipes]